MPQTAYDPNLTLAEAVKQYFVDNNFGPDGGYGDDWVELKLGPIPFFIPNTKERVRAVRFHDLHHLLTGYRTDFAGEFEISAWELATWCADHRAAWVLNLSGLISGLLVWPRRTVAAFRRGRRSHNLYRSEYGQKLLSQTIGETVKQLGLDRQELGPVTLGDVLALIGYILLGIPTGLFVLAGSILLTPVALIQNALRPRKPAAA